MKKVLSLIVLGFVFLTSLGYATLTPTNVPVTKTGGSAPVLQNGSMFDSGTAAGVGNVGVGAAAITTGGTGGFDLPSSNVHYVPCGGSLATAYSNATAGDTIQLGKCTYNISVGITGSKSVHWKGVGKYDTIINAGTNNIEPFSFTAPESFSDMSIVGTNAPGGIDINLCGGTCDSNVSTGLGTTSDANYFTNIYINVSLATNTTTGINIFDGGYTINNSTIIASSGTYATSPQSFAVRDDCDASTTADVHAYVYNSQLQNISTDTVGYTVTILRAIRFYNWQTNTNTHNMFLTLSHADLKVSDQSAFPNGTEALHIQGNNITAYIDDSLLDGDVRDNVGTNNTISSRKDLRCDDGAVCYMYGDKLVNGYYQSQGGAILTRAGSFWGSSIILDQTPQNAPSSTNGIAANALFSGTGALGGASYATGSVSGGTGALISLTAGAGGKATASTATATGGIGGGITYTAGAGAAETITTSSVNIGGKGGTLTLSGGPGGNATGASTTNTGGVGGDIIIQPGAGSTGTTTNGGAGTVFFKSNGTQSGIISSILSDSCMGVSCLSAITSGTDDSSIGASSLGHLTSGQLDTAVGYGAGLATIAGNNSTSTNSVYIGYLTKASADGDANENVIGYAAIGNGSNTTTIGNTSVTAAFVSGNLTTHGTAPTITSCGTSPSGSAVGNGNGFTITVGGTTTTCTATFATAFTNTPSCTVTNQSMSVINAMTYTVSNTAVVINQTGLSGDILNVNCIGNY